MAYGLQDVITLRQMLLDTDAEEQYKRASHHKLESMLGLCELTTCRRQALLAYFGEQLAEPCGNCDNCLSPPETWDATEAAQKALSCVYRTGQRFGVNYVIDVLIGKEDERIRRNRHDRLSTFGIGTELSVQEWRGVLRQLIVLGYLGVDSEGYGALRLTDNCRALLRSEQRLELRRLRKPEKKTQRKGARRAQELGGADQLVFEALRALRLRIAQEQGVPPYVIFHDSTLQEMAHARPATPVELLAISGVGEGKLQRYGQAFLEEIRAHPLAQLPDNGLSDTVNETLYLARQGLDAEAIAARRSLKPSTIYSHLAEAVEAGLLEPRQVLALDERDYQRIREVMERLGICEQGELKVVYEALGEVYDYGILRCIRAALCPQRL
jgi:ATP-dependent DNA helicase RecQ